MLNPLRPIAQAATRSRALRVLRHPVLALSFTALSLLLLVLVLLSVPGPIKGLYWFSVPGEQDTAHAGALSVGVLGWCSVNTSDCTYAPLSNNPYLSTMIDTGEALTVRMMLPLACFWTILTLAVWVGLAAFSQRGYRLSSLDSIARHLRFAVLEACVLCITFFATVLCWLAFGFGRNAYVSVLRGGGHPRTGHAMETAAVAALMSLASFGLAVVGLHLRLGAASERWKREAVMVRRKSQVLMASSLGWERAANVAGLAEKEFGKGEKAGGSTLGPEGDVEADPGHGMGSYDMAVGGGPAGSDVRRSSIAKYTYNTPAERSLTGSTLTAEPAPMERVESKRTSILRYAEPPISRDQERAIRRESMTTADDSPYAAIERS